MIVVRCGLLFVVVCGCVVLLCVVVWCLMVVVRCALLLFCDVNRRWSHVVLFVVCCCSSLCVVVRCLWLSFDVVCWLMRVTCSLKKLSLVVVWCRLRLRLVCCVLFIVVFGCCVGLLCL